MQNISAFTCTHDEIVRRLQSKVHVCLGTENLEAEALWDTGATTTSISYDVVKNLNLQATGCMTIKTPSGSKVVNTYLVDIILPNNVRIIDIPVCDSDIGEQGLGVLIGMDIITKGDFMLTNYNNKTVFTFRVPSLNRTDFVKQIDFDRTIGPRHGIKHKKKKKK